MNESYSSNETITVVEMKERVYKSKQKRTTNYVRTFLSRSLARFCYWSALLTNTESAFFDFK